MPKETSGSAKITVDGDIGAGSAIGDRAKVEAEIIAGRDIVIEKYYADGQQNFTHSYEPPPLPEAKVIPEPLAQFSPSSRMLLRHNRLFTGRDKQLLKLAESFIFENNGFKPKTIVISGIGGIGKTQLAVEFAYHYGRFLSGGVFWLNFAEVENVPSEIAACGRANALNLHPDYDELPQETQIALVQRAWKESIPRLLIFDNCELEGLLDYWRPVIGNCHVLVTSRRRQWSTMLNVGVVPLDVLARSDSVTLLRRFVPSLSEVEAKDIAIELGDLPLALHLAGSYLQIYGDVEPPDIYLRRLRDSTLLEHPSLVGRGATINPTKHELHVGRTFALGYEQLTPDKGADRQAQRLLMRAAHFAPGTPIPRKLLLATVQAEKEDLEAALVVCDGLNRLLSLGLIAEEPDKALLLHRLLVEFIKGLGDDSEAQTNVEETLLTVVIDINETGYPASLLPLQGHLRHVAESASKRHSKMTGSFWNELGFHLNLLGKYEEAEVAYRQALTFWEMVSGADHINTAISLNNLGNLLMTKGDVDNGRLLLERALVIRRKTLGLNHSQTADTLNNLGRLLHKMGNLTEAKSHYEQAYNIWKQLSDSKTATALNNLGIVFLEIGNLSKAQEVLVQALAECEKLYEPEHPVIATTLHNLGLLFYEKNDLKKALAYCERALMIREKVLKTHSRDIAKTQNDLGVILYSMRDFAKAREYFKQALKIRERNLGEEHPDTQAVRQNLKALSK